ncbi:O-acetyl-ADP-ribose deacetylase [Notoacmeibacter ruber]|uniref:O-acetyl-ADP-ribose deacetylase n=1 Tax=Notoacmeibacter ruber TaxID=2670375 RepID=UPI001FDEBB46|nr:O-acetyl-ADP-ribose deacetylase [Notoacmeibacter ruber]
MTEKDLLDRIEVIVGDITALSVDAVVNAANESLLGGGGVDGAVHRAAGKDLLAECRTLGGCPTGEARITGGYKLPARHVIHTVGPVWHGGDRREEALLRSAYRNSLRLASENACESVAFPAISTGVYAYPKPAAANVAVSEIATFLRNHKLPKTVVLCAFDETTAELYRSRLAEVQ